MWILSTELIGLPGIPSTPAGFKYRADKENWLKRKPEGVKGRAYEYSFDSLPAETQQYILAQKAKEESAKRAEQVKEIREKFADEKQKATPEEKSVALNQMNGWSKERQNRCFVRYEIITSCEDYIRNVAMMGVRRTQATNDFIEMFNARSLQFGEDIYRVVHGKLSGPTLRRWRKDYRDGGISNLDRRQNPRKDDYVIESQPEMKAYALSMISDFPHVNGKGLRDAIKADFSGAGAQIPSVSAAQRWLNWWKSKNPSLFSASSNPDAWKNTKMQAFGNASEGIHELNQVWELDATPADLQLTLADGSRRRYHISGLIDVYSRAPMLLVTETPRTEANAALLRRAILKKGKPQKVKLDNGSDYVSRGMMMVLDSLDIEYDICPPFSPWKKPHIERFFRSFSHGLLEFKPGFIGHNVAERKAIEARKTFAERLMNKDDVIDVGMSPEELQQFCDEWVENIYMHRVHKGLKATPFEMVSNYQGEITTISNERALDQLLSVPTQGGTRTVNKKGIDIDGINYIAAELAVHIGTQVLVRHDKDDLGQIVVSSLEGAFICVAVNPEYLGISRAEIALEAKRLQREHVAEHKKQVKAASRKYKTKEVAVRVMQSAADDAGKVVSMPKPGVEYTNSFIQGATEAADALEGKASSTLPPITEKDIHDLQMFMREEQKQDETAEDRFRRWIGLDEKMSAGESIDEFNATWKKQYENTSEFQGRKMVYDSLGGSQWAKVK